MTDGLSLDEMITLAKQVRNWSMVDNKDESYHGSVGNMSMCLSFERKRIDQRQLSSSVFYNNKELADLFSTRTEFIYSIGATTEHINLGYCSEEAYYPDNKIVPLFDSARDYVKRSEEERKQREQERKESALEHARSLLIQR